MTKNKPWKRVAAGLLALALVTGGTPANVGGFLTGGTAIVANAEDAELTDTIQLYRDSDTETDNGTSRTYNGTYADVSGKCVYGVFNGGTTILKGLSVHSEGVTITANETLPANYVIQNVTFHVGGGYGNVDESTVAVSSGTVTNYGQTLTIENVNSKTFKLSNPGVRSYDVESVTITYAEKVPTELTADDFEVTLPTSLEYDGSAKAVTVKLKEEEKYPGVVYTVTYTKSSDTTFAGLPTNVGQYHPVITIDDDENYKGKSITDTTWDFSITRAVNKVTNAAAIADQKLTNLENFVKVQPKVGSPDSVEYSLDEDIWSTEVPKIPDPSIDKIVYYRLAGTDNYTELTGRFNVSYRTSLLASDTVAESDSNDKASYRLSNEAIKEGHPSLDVRGKSGTTDIQVTFSNGGFGTYMSVGNGGTSQVGQELGKVTKIDDIEVKLVPSVTEDADGVMLTYTIANVGFDKKNVRIGSCGDTQLNGDDRCDVECEKGYPYITMTNGDTKFFVNAQEGSQEDFKRWVGSWPGEIGNVFSDYNDYSSGNDSAIAWSWDVDLEGGQTRTFKVLLSATCSPVVTYDLNYEGGVNPTSSIIKYIGQELEIPDPHRAGYDFVNWTYTKAAKTTYDKDGNVISEEPEQKNVVFKSGDPVNYSMALTANWKPHEYQYSVVTDSNSLYSSITATCKNGEHPENTKSASLKLSIPSATKNYDGTPFEASLAETNNFREEVGAVTGDTFQIKYEGIDGTVYPVTTEAPTKAGNYRAFVTISDKTIKKEFSILEKYDLTDDHSDDSLVRKSDNVRNAIRSISIDADGNGTFSDDETTTFSETVDAKDYYYWKQGDKVQIKSIAKLVFTTDEGEIEVSEKSSSTEGCYTYDFTVPYGVNIVTVKRVYNYSFRNVDAKSLGKNDYAFPKVEYQVAELIAEDYEYLDKLESHIKFNVADEYELKYSVDYTYTKDGEIVKNPTEIGTYEVTAKFTTNNQVYKIVDTFEITPRNYATHSGSAATDTNKIEAKIGFKNAENDEISDSTVYNTKSQTPTVTIKDTLNENVKPLVRGTDYELGYLDNDGNFVKVDTADDAATFGKTAAGTYKVYVQFKGNYMNKVEGVEGPVELTWHIVPAELTADDVTAPEALKLTYNTEDQYLVKPGSAGQIGTVYYSLTGEEKDYDVVVPKAKDAGVYTVYWYVEGDSNHTNYTAANAENQIIVTIAPKSITAAVELSDDTFTYDGNAKKFATVTVKDGDTVIDASEYALAYDNNIVAGENTAKLTVSDAKTGKNAGADWTGNYTFDDVVKTFSIARADATITVAPKEITYDGEKVDQTDFTIKENNSDTEEIVLTFYADNNGEQGEKLTSAPVNAGTYWVVASVAETENYLEAASKAVQFTIAQRDISGVTITVDEADEPAADGVKPQVPVKFTVTDSEINKTLVSGSDFTAEYGNNVESGNEATIKLTGTGNYTGTANGIYSVLATLDISEVKDLITSIEYNDETTTENFKDNYSFRTDTKIKVVSRGVLKFGELTDVDSEETNTGYIYELTIPAGTTSTKVTHIYNYATSQETDADGKVTVYGVDNNVIGNTEKVEIVTLEMDKVYYLDDATSKITISDKKANGVTLGNAEYTYTKQDVENNTGTIVNGKPVNVGNYSVKIKVNVTDGDGVEFVYVDIKFDVLPREYDGEEIQVAITTDEYTYSAKDITPEITVTDSKRADGEQTLIKGTDYNLTGDITKKGAGSYTVTVVFTGNYSGEKPVTWTINPKDIESEDVKITYPSTSILKTTGYTTCEPIVIEYNGETLKANTDYKVENNSTNKVKDSLSVLINGMGNYTGNTYLDWSVISPKNVSSEITGYEMYDEKGKIVFNYENAELDYEDVSYGVLVYRDGVLNSDMTVTNLPEGAVNSTLASAGGSFRSKDKNNGIYVRPYTKVGNDYVYGEQVYVKHADLLNEAILKDAESAITDYAMYDTDGRIVFTYENTELEYDSVSYGVLVYRDGDLNSDMTVTNLPTDAVNSTLASAGGSFRSRDKGTGIYVRPYIKSGDKYVYGEQVYVKHKDLLNAAALAEAKSEVTGYVKADDEGRITFSYENTYTGTEAVTYGVLVYREGELTGDMTVDTANVLNSTLTNAVGTVRSKDRGTGLYVRTYMLIGNEYIYGEQVFVKHEDLVKAEALANAKSEITGYVRADDAGRITFSYKNTYTGTETVTYGVLVYREGELTEDMTVDTANVLNSTLDNAEGTVRSKDKGTGLYVRTYMLIGNEYIYGEQVFVKHADLS